MEKENNSSAIKSIPHHVPNIVEAVLWFIDDVIDGRRNGATLSAHIEPNVTKLIRRQKDGELKHAAKATHSCSWNMSLCPNTYESLKTQMVLIPKKANAVKMSRTQW